MSEELTPLEKEVYELIKKSGELLTTDVPPKKRGVVPHLIRTSNNIQETHFAVEPKEKKVSKGERSIKRNN